MEEIWLLQQTFFTMFKHLIFSKPEEIQALKEPLALADYCWALSF